MEKECIYWQDVIDLILEHVRGVCFVFSLVEFA